MKLRLLLLVLLTSFSFFAFAQSNQGGIDGRVTDEKGDAMSGATVKVLEGGIVKGGGRADLNGNYRVKPLSPGTYDVEVSYLGYPKKIVQGVKVNIDDMQTLNVKMEKESGNQGVKIKTVVVQAEKTKLIDASNPNSKIMTKEQIKQMPTLNSADMAAMSGGVYQRKAGDNDLNLSGGRSSNTMYLIDGMMVSGGRNVNFAPGVLESIQVMNTGLSAKYGNATGGIVAIQTRGITPKTRGGVSMQSSVEGYFQNFLSFDISGPLYSKKTKQESGAILKTPKVGYVFNVSGNYDKDPNPSFDRYTIVKPEVLSKMIETPLVANPGGGSYIDATNLLRSTDFTTIKARQQGNAISGTVLGKINWSPNDRTSVTAQGTFNYGRSRGWGLANSLAAPQANSINNNYTGRGLVRLTQSLGKSQKKEDDATPSIFSNAFYTLQASYQKDFSSSMNPNHKTDIFNYGYIGKYNQFTTPFYTQDTVKGGYFGWKYLGERQDSLTFTPGGINPNLEKYNNVIYSNPLIPIGSQNTLQFYNGLLNGDAPNSIYGLFTSPGAQIGGIGEASAERVIVSLDASFDIQQGSKNVKNKEQIVHQIEFGLGYEQRSDRSYNISASQLWTLMRLLQNKHINTFDLDNPIFKVNGQNYNLTDLKNGVIQFSEFDSVYFNRQYVEKDHSRFDKELRKKLFAGNERDLTVLNINNMDPSQFSLDMFSADDLLNNGNGYVGYSGYDYKGKRLTSQPSFNDFWSKKDERGDFARPIGAYQPNYLWGYVLDKFKFKDMRFNIGLRVDRFDANQKVLKDPYSFYGVRSVADLSKSAFQVAKDGEGNSAPNPISSGFDNTWVPYIDNNTSANPTIVGYRKGDVWYDPFGKQVSDPSILSGTYANGLPIAPYLVNVNDSIKSSSFQVNNSFQDYKPHLTVSPRIQFTFPISDDNLFYGNYDVISQYPSGANFVTPDDYYYQDVRNATLSNANLRMERTVNYTIGYEQKLSKKSKIGFEVAYRERKDQIQLQQFLNAFPTAYTSFGNRDFSTTKGFTLKYDMRRTGPIRLTVDYTLQFAEGTGSSATSGRSLFATTQPALRTLNALDFDSRHMVNTVIDYRYFEGEGPKIKKTKGEKVKEIYPLENVGFALTIRARSGEPFTKGTLAFPIGGSNSGSQIQGGLNGSRLPWNYEMNLRVDKTLELFRVGMKKDENGVKNRKSGKAIEGNIYCLISNLLNTRNVLGVYSYTGSATDDGYLTSPIGQQALQNTYIFPDSYSDIYKVRMLNPGNFNNPRRIAFGINFNF